MRTIQYVFSLAALLIVAANPSAHAAKPGTGGNQPPSVSITSPLADDSFATGSPLTIEAVATDSNGSISKVEFFRNGILLGRDTSPPFRVTWSNPAAGSYALTAVATDSARATATSGAVAITVAAAQSCSTLPASPSGLASTGQTATSIALQ